MSGAWFVAVDASHSGQALASTADRVTARCGASWTVRAGATTVHTISKHDSKHKTAKGCKDLIKPVLLQLLCSIEISEATSELTHVQGMAKIEEFNEVG